MHLSQFYLLLLQFVRQYPGSIAVMAEELNMNLTTAALNGGEDYELLFTVPIADHEKVEQMEGVKLIGHITKEGLGCALITRDGAEFELKAQGWNPLKK